MTSKIDCFRVLAQGSFNCFEMSFLGEVDQLALGEKFLQGMRKKRRNKIIKDFSNGIYNKAIVYKTDAKQLSLENFKQTPLPFRSPYKLKKILEDFPDYSSKIGSWMSYKDINDNVKKLNNFNVKESKKKYSLKTYSKVRGCYIGDIMFESKHAAFLILININTRYAYGYQIGDFEIIEDNGKQIQLYTNKNRKNFNSLNKAFEQFIVELRSDFQFINILRFDGEAAINSKEFRDYIKQYSIVLEPTIPKQHTSLSIIDRLIRTLRDIAFNLGYEWNL